MVIRFKIDATDQGPSFTPLKTKKGHGRDGQVKEAVWHGKSITVGGQPVDKNSLIDLLKYQHGQTQLKKGIFGIGRSDDAKVEAAFNEVFLFSSLAKKNIAIPIETDSIEKEDYPPKGFVEVGSTQLMNVKTNELVEVKIFSGMKGKSREYQVYHDGKMVGNMVFSIMQMKKNLKNEDYYDYGNGDNATYSAYRRYDTTEEDFSKRLFIRDLRAPGNDKFKGIGSTLMQAAYETSKKEGCGGRIIFDASYQSPVFYYKLGFRAAPGSRPEVADLNNKTMEALANERKQWDENGGSVTMYLPESAMAEWDAKVDKGQVISKF